MATISTLAYKIVADTQNFLDGVKLSRSEMQAAKQVFKESIDPVTAYKAELDALAMLHEKGALDANQYAAAVARTAAKSDPAVIAQREAEALATQQAADAAKEREAVLQRGLALSQSLATPEEQRAMRLKEAKDLLDQNAISQEDYNRVIARERAAVVQLGDALRQSLATPEEQRAVRLREAKALLDQNAISQEDFNRAVKRLDTEKYQEAGAKLEAIGTKIRNVGVAIAAAGAAVSAGIVAIGRDLLASYSEEQDAAAKLAAAMQASGTMSEAAFASYREYASEMQRLTVVGDETTLGMLQMAESLGVTGTAAERAVKNAIAFGAAMGVDAESAMKMTTALEQGQTTLLNRYLPALRLIEDPVLRAAEAQRLLGNMFSVAEAEANTYAGSAQQLANAWGDFKESLGAVIAEGLTPLIQYIRSGVDALNSMSPSTRQTIVYVGGLTAALGTLVFAGGTVVAIAGQMVIWYGALTAAAATSTAATITMTAATIAAKVAMGGFAIAVAGVIGYQIGRWLQELTESGRTAAGVLANLRDEAAALSNIDVTGTSKEALEQYIASTERQIQKTKEHNEQLQQGQAWWNFWQKNADLVDANKQRLDALNTTINAARKQLAGMAAPVMPTADETAAKAASEVQKVTDKINEQIATVGMSKDELDVWKLSQEGATAAQLDFVEGMQRQLAAREAQQALKEDTDKLIDSLQRQITTTGLSADEVTRMELAARGLRPEWLSVVEALQTDLAAKQTLEETRQEVDKLTQSLEQQLETSKAAAAGWSQEDIELWKLAKKGVHPVILANIKAMQDEIKTNNALTKARQKAADDRQQLKGDLKELTKELKEQIKTHGMSADELTRHKLKQRGATDDELAGIQAMQDELADLQSQKDAMRASDTTIGAGSLADAYDAIQRAREAAVPREVAPPVVEVPVIPEPPPIVPPSTVISVSWKKIPPPPVVPNVPVEMTAQPTVEASITAADLAYMEQASAYIQQVQDAATTFAGTVPVAEPPVATTVPEPPEPAFTMGGQDQTANEEPVSPEVPLLARIAAGIDALVRKEGIVIEEVTI